MSESTAIQQSGGGGGLNNLFALAHLASLSEEGRRAASSSPRNNGAGSPPREPVMTSNTSSPSIENGVGVSCRTVSSSRRPAKKRSVPAEFDHAVDVPTLATGTPPSNSQTATARTPTGRKLTVENAPAGQQPVSYLTSRQSPSGSRRRTIEATTATAATVGMKQPSPSSCRRLTIETSKPSSSTFHNKRSKSVAKSSSSNNGIRNRGSSTTFKMKANQPSFPVILMAIMIAPQNKEFIAFLSDSQRFLIIHPGALAKNVLPIHFEDNVPTFDQFLYLLAIWGFEVVKDPQYPEVNVYKHHQFRKGDWEACLQMKLPDPNDPQVNEAVKNMATKSSSPGRNNESNRRSPDSHSSPRRNAVVDNGHLISPQLTVRSVTPPCALPLSDAILLEQVALPHQHQKPRQQQFSNLGPKYSSLEENLKYRHLLQESMMSQGINLLPQPMLPHSISLGTQGIAMRGYPTSATSSPIDRPSMPRYRRATFDMDMPSMSFPTMGNNVSGMSPRMRGRSSMPFPTGYQSHQKQMPQAMGQNQAPSDAHVMSATKDIVSKAIDALRQNENMSMAQATQAQAQHMTRPAHRSRRHTVDSMPMPTNNGTMSRLDAMTDLFLERSFARLQSRPVSIMGQRTQSPSRGVTQGVSAGVQQQPLFMGGDANSSNFNNISRQSLVDSVGAEVEAHTKACLSYRQQRKVSMPMGSCYGM